MDLDWTGSFKLNPFHTLALTYVHIRRQFDLFSKNYVTIVKKNEKGTFY